MNQDSVNRALMFYELADAQEQLNEIVDRFTPDAEIDENDFRCGSPTFTGTSTVLGTCGTARNKVRI